MCRILKRLFRELENLCPEEIKVRWKIGPIREHTSTSFVYTTACCKKGVGDMGLILSDSQKFDATVGFVDKKGQPAKVDGVPSWTVSDPTILSVEPAADGMSATVKAIGPLGTSQVSVTADADLGEGVRNVVGTLDVEVVAGEAVAANINAGAPVEQ